MPGHDDDSPDLAPPSLPPGEVTPAELLRAAFPLVVQASSQAATAATMAAEQARATDQALSEFKGALERNTNAVNRLALAKEKENELLEAQNKTLKQAGVAKRADNKRLHETVRASMTSPVILQIIQLVVIVGAALGLWAQMPTLADQPATIPEAADHPPGHVP